MGTTLESAIRDWSELARRIKGWRRAMQDIEDTAAHTLSYYPNARAAGGSAAAEVRLAELQANVDRAEAQLRALEQRFAGDGTDLEYLATEIDPSLRPGMWLHNYYIERRKRKGGGYDYATYESLARHEGKVYSSLYEAVDELNSRYAYLQTGLTVEEIVDSMRYTIQ